MKAVRWGVLSTANIAVVAMIPGLRKARGSEVVGLASRDLARAREVATRLAIPRAYGSYEELLADPDIDAVYNPLPNNLHVPWTMRALDAGKHVLCEKPLGLNASEGLALLEHARRHPRLKVMEAFMYRHHPQWRQAVEFVANGAIGRLKTVDSFFSYRLSDPRDIRNRSETGGGGLLDIGCYCVSLSRLLWDGEPRRVFAAIEWDEAMGVDRLASAVLEFEGGNATFTCGTQLSPRQRVQVVGDRGSLVIERPFNAPPDAALPLHLERDGELETVIVAPADQYQLQAELFVAAIEDDAPVPVPLEDAIANMRVIDALFDSARRGSAVTLA